MALFHLSNKYVPIMEALLLLGEKYAEKGTQGEALVKSLQVQLEKEKQAYSYQKYLQETKSEQKARGDNSINRNHERGAATRAGPPDQKEQVRDKAGSPANKEKGSRRRSKEALKRALKRGAAKLT